MASINPISKRYTSNKIEQFQNQPVCINGTDQSVPSPQVNGTSQPSLTNVPVETLASATTAVNGSPTRGMLDIQVFISSNL